MAPFREAPTLARGGYDISAPPAKKIQFMAERSGSSPGSTNGINPAGSNHQVRAEGVEPSVPYEAKHPVEILGPGFFNSIQIPVGGALP